MAKATRAEREMEQILQICALRDELRTVREELNKTRAKLTKADNELNAAADDLERQGRELADARLDSARLDWLQEWMKFGRNDLLTRYQVFDGKVYANLIHPDAEMGAKAIPGRDNIRAAIDAAIKEAK